MLSELCLIVCKPKSRALNARLYLGPKLLAYWCDPSAGRTRYSRTPDACGSSWLLLLRTVSGVPTAFSLETMGKDQQQGWFQADAPKQKEKVRTDWSQVLGLQGPGKHPVWKEQVNSSAGEGRRGGGIRVKGLSLWEGSAFPHKPPALGTNRGQILSNLTDRPNIIAQLSFK